MSAAKNYLLTARHAIADETAAAQRRILPKIRGKVVSRAGTLLHVLKASARRGVEFEVIATGQTQTMVAKNFLARKIEVVDPPAAWKRTLELPVPERAHAMATAAEVKGAVKLRWLYVLRRGTERDSADRRACDYYIGALKRGEKPIKKWKPDR